MMVRVAVCGLVKLTRAFSNIYLFMIPAAAGRKSVSKTGGKIMKWKHILNANLKTNQMFENAPYISYNITDCIKKLNISNE